MNDKWYYDLKKEIEGSKHFRDLELTDTSKKKILKNTYINEILGTVFIFLLTIFLIFLFFTNDDILEFLYINGLIRILVFIAVVAGAIYVSKQIDYRLSALRLQFLFHCIGILVLILFFVYQAFTPYFYTEEKLKNIGIEKIEMYYKLSDETVDRKKLAEKALYGDMAFGMFLLESYPKGELIKIEVIDVSRNFDRYSLTARLEIQYDDKLEVSKYDFEFNKEDGEFKIIGISFPY